MRCIPSCVLTLLVFLCVPASQLTAQQGPPSTSTAPKTTERPSRAHFAQAALDALVMAASARDALSVNADKGDSATTFETMTAKRLAINRLESGRGLFVTDRKSDDADVKDVAETFDRVFEHLQDLFRRGIELDQSLLEARTEGDINKLVSPMSEWAANVDEAWRMLPTLTIALAHTLVDASRVVGDKHPYLRMTAAERRDLIARVKKMFTAATAKPEGGHAVDVSASLLLGFLQQPWKGSDER